MPAAIETFAVEVNKQEPVELPTFANWQSLFEQIALDQRQDNRWEFSAHNWMNNRWQRERPDDAAVTFKQEVQLLAWHPFVYTNQQGEVSVQLPRIRDARPLRMTVEAVGWHSSVSCKKSLL